MKLLSFFNHHIGALLKFYSILFIVVICFAQEKKTITIPSSDNLILTADLYLVHDKSAPFIVLFHQAGWSRGEYLEIAPKLNKLGFNCLALDQRSGNKVNNIANESAIKADKLGLDGRYIDAIPDIIAAVNFVRDNYAHGKIIAWGSSYSSALVLNLAGSNQIDVDAVMSFAPGEYFAKQGKKPSFIQDAAQYISVPVFITSAKNEHKNWKMILDKVKPELRNSYLPETKGNHGSRALWEKFDDNQGYWDAVITFLNKVK